MILSTAAKVTYSLQFKYDLVGKMRKGSCHTLTFILNIFEISRSIVPLILIIPVVFSI